MSVNLSQLEEQTAALLIDLEGWPAERLRFRPAEGAWSAVQVIDHLARTEREIQVRVRDGLGAPHRIGVRDRLGTLFLDRIFRSDRKVKVPGSADAVLPGADPQLPDVAMQWEASRQELAALLTQSKPEQTGLGVFRHPVGGWMSLGGVLDFFSVHMHHHRFQLDALYQASEGKGGSIPG